MAQQRADDPSIQLTLEIKYRDPLDAPTLSNPAAAAEGPIQRALEMPGFKRPGGEFDRELGEHLRPVVEPLYAEPIDFIVYSGGVPGDDVSLTSVRFHITIMVWKK